MPSNDASVVTVSIIAVNEDSVTHHEDELSVEEPLEIRINLPRPEGMLQSSLAVTMRTPGNDAELAAGFLFTEGLVRVSSDIVRIDVSTPNVVEVWLGEHVKFDPARFDRHSVVTSSCGVCGKRSIDAVFALRPAVLSPGTPMIASRTIHGLADSQRAEQTTFHRTGGLHASALYEPDGQLIALYEDVGRHNALDKLIGAEFLAGRTPLSDKLLLVSGRASFELIQKSAVACIPVVAAVGAPSSLAVELARQSQMTLLGFVRDKRFNVYADSGRLVETFAGVDTVLLDR